MEQVIVEEIDSSAPISNPEWKVVWSEKDYDSVILFCSSFISCCGASGEEQMNIIWVQFVRTHVMNFLELQAFSIYFTHATLISFNFFVNM